MAAKEGNCSKDKGTNRMRREEETNSKGADAGRPDDQVPGGRSLVAVAAAGPLRGHGGRRDCAQGRASRGAAHPPELRFFSLTASLIMLLCVSACVGSMIYKRLFPSISLQRSPLSRLESFPLCPRDLARPACRNASSRSGSAPTRRHKGPIERTPSLTVSPRLSCSFLPAATPFLLLQPSECRAAGVSRLA